MTGAAVASAVGGGLSLIGGKRDSDKASEAGDKAVAAAQQNVGTANELSAYLKQLGQDGSDNAQRMLDDWEGTFGGIQDNLSDYYSNLDPTKYSTEAKAKLSQSMDKQMLQFNEDMSAQGLQSAGMKQQAGLESTFRQAEANAAIDLGAEDKVRGMQQGFLNSGANQQASANNAKTNAITQQGNFANTGSTAMMNANNSIANAYTGQAQSYGQSSAGYMGAAGSMFGSALGLGLNAGGGGSTATQGTGIMQGSNRTATNPGGASRNYRTS